LERIIYYQSKQSVEYWSRKKRHFVPCHSAVFPICVVIELAVHLTHMTKEDKIGHIYSWGMNWFEK
jgi:hypothetical protein